MTGELADACSRAVRLALKAGADEAEAFTSLSRETDIYIESNDVKMGKAHRKGGIGIRLFKNKALGFASVNSFQKTRVEEAVDKAIKIASSSVSDPHNHLPEPGKATKLRGLYDCEAETFTASDALNRCLEMLRAAKSLDPRVTVDSGTFTSAVEEHCVFNSLGVNLEEKVSVFAWTIMGMAVDGADVSSFDVQVGSSHFASKVSTAGAGESLARNVVASLGAKKVEGFTGPILLSPEAVQDLLVSALIHSSNSNNVQKGVSRFAGKAGQQVSSSLLTFLDDGTLVEGLAAGSFDREGVPHKSLTVIEEGILKSYLYNTYTASKEERESTGHAAGDTRASPTVGPSNIIIKEGDKSTAQLLGEITRGILVTRFSGNVNPVSGDFSGVVKGGRLITSGELRSPVKETLIAGNLYQALNKISGVSKERKMIFNYLLPYMRVEDVSVTSS
ncbi:MAG: TldD/PmbA family protein [Thaumarchaeota archaeon]|nr:TldD/PmbA family protein [Nitrososphaerota archaeon]